MCYLRTSLRGNIRNIFYGELSSVKGKIFGIINNGKAR